MFEFIEGREFLGQLSGCQVFKCGFCRECFLIGWLPSAHVWSVVEKAKSDILKHMRGNAVFSVRPIGSCSKYSIFTTQWLLIHTLKVRWSVQRQNILPKSRCWRNASWNFVTKLVIRYEKYVILIQRTSLALNKDKQMRGKKGNGQEKWWKRIINSVGVNQSCKACALKRERERDLI
jgi:hypothetical protein